jgi:hypothetical protein
VAVSPDGRCFASGSQDRTAIIWDAATRKQTQILEGHGGGVWAVNFSPDGKRLVTGSWDGTAKVWDTRGGKEILALKGHASPVGCACFSPDGHWIVTGGGDETARIWDAHTGKEVFTLPHSGLNSASFSPDNRRLVTAGDDQTLKVWELTTGKELLSLKSNVGDHSAALAAVFSHDGRELISGGEGNVARIWQAASSGQVTEWREAELAFSKAVAQAQSQASPGLEHRNVAVVTTNSTSSGTSYDDGGEIRHWLVLSPIPFEGRFASPLETEQILREAQLQPHAGQRGGIAGLERFWTPVHLDGIALDFNQLAGRVTEWSVAYAVTYLRSDKDRRELQLLVGSDDDVLVYLNGKPVHHHIGIRQWIADNDVVPGVELNAGVNTLVMKVVNYGGDWGGSVRFTDAAGRPVEGIRVSLTPP